ncbi:MAG TPA: basic amino acid/polyamine antiporter [Mycobacterium sp.]|nr:basic amino acid/polyamine antiporter [Mycobacterium sp.]HQC77412.1 basic amino acid/polyamine antiporter [Mycobacterium sp.]
MTTSESAEVAADKKVSVGTLTAMVVGSIVGSGVFVLPRRFATEAGALGALIAWAIAGSGMFMLALVFRSLAVRKPDLNAGIFAYAKAGFGDYVGFNAAFGYWASAVAGTASYWVLAMSTLGAVFPALGQGETLLAIGLSSIGVWVFHFLVLRGVHSAAAINRIVTVAKMVPIVVFIVVGIIFFKTGVFADNFWGGSDHSFAAIFAQAKGTMLITVFVFLGIEGASVYSRYARKRSDIGKATVLGFLSVLSVFVLVTMVSYGAMPQADLKAATPPSTATVFESMVGNWGEIFIKVGVVISVLGAYLAWTLMACEVLYVPASTGDMPRFLTKINVKGTPSSALLLVSLYVQGLLILLLFVANALDFILDLTAALAVIPYLLAAGYALKLTIRRETYDGDDRALRTDRIVAVLAVVYTAFLVYAAGPKHLLLSCLLYAPAALLYAKARREQGLRVFTPPELALFGIILLGAVVAVELLITGTIRL